MILKRIQLRNFFRYSGKQSIEFVHDSEKNVTVVKGENGYGKTTILGAFSWCFYGELELPLIVDKMFNKRARIDLAENDVGSTSVEIDFEDKGVNYTIRREQLFKKQNNEMYLAGDQKLSITYTDEVGNSREVIDPRNFINKIIPIKLRQFFFFDGEKINRLAQEDGREEIKEAILNLLGLNVIENLKDDLEKVDAKLNRDLKKYLRGKEADLSEKKGLLILEKQKLLRELETSNKTKKEQEAHAEEISKFLQAHNSNTVTSLEKEREAILLDISRLDGDLKQINTKINKLFSSKAKDMLVSDYLQPIFDTLEDKREKGELPSDLKQTFIEDLINKKRCICGTIIERGSLECNNLEKLLKTAGRRELDDAYIKIVSYINSNKNAPNDFYSEYNSLMKSEQEKGEELTRKNSRIKEIDKQLKTIDTEEIARKVEYRQVITKKIYDIGSDIKLKKQDLEKCEKEIKAIAIEIENAQVQNVEALKIKEQINKVQKLIQLNNKVSETFKEEVRVDLDRRIKEVFKSISHKGYREPVLTENLMLKVVNSFSSNLEDEILSTGESQVSSLSFIGALVSYSRDKQNSTLYSDFMGGDFPIVMDSPFGNLDSKHSAHIAKGIGDLSNQVIVIVSQKQWANEVEQNIYSRIGKMYKLISDDINEENYGECTKVEEVAI